MKKMKKRYITPAMKAAAMEMENLMTDSGVVSTQGIGYGGVDEGGTIEPAARGYNGMWDEE